MNRTSCLMGLLSIVLLAPASLFSAELEIGSLIPKFEATNVDGKKFGRESFKDARMTVFCFTCNGCPVAGAYEARFKSFAKEYKAHGVEFVAINGTYTDTQEAVKRHAKDKGYEFPYLFDGTAETARSFGATNTPHVFVFDSDSKLVYRGAFDDKWIGGEPTKHYVKSVVDAYLNGQVIEYQETKAVGCAIRFKRR